MDDAEQKASPARRMTNSLGLTYNEHPSSKPPRGWFAKILWAEQRIQELERRVEALEQGRSSAS